METIIGVEQWSRIGRLYTKITTSHRSLSFNVANETNCCQQLGIKYVGSSLTDLINSYLLKMEINLSNNQLPSNLVTQILHEDREDFGYSITKITYRSGNQDKELYLIFTNGCEYVHRLYVTEDDTIILDIWI